MANHVTFENKLKIKTRIKDIFKVPTFSIKAIYRAFALLFL